MILEKGSGDGLCTARIGIFSTLSPEDQRLLVRKARHRHVGEGVTIFHENDPAEQILVVHSGRVKLNRYLPDGREYVLDTLTGGGIYGEQWLFSSKRHEVNAITLEPASYCEIHRDDILTLVRQHPDVGIGMLFELGSKLSRVSRMHELLSIRDARARLAGYLLLPSVEPGGSASGSAKGLASACDQRGSSAATRRPRTSVPRLSPFSLLGKMGCPPTSNGPTEAINGRLEHLRGSALGFRNLTNYIARSLLETGGFRPRLHPGL